MGFVLLWPGRVERGRDALVLRCEPGCGRSPIWAGLFGSEEGRDMPPARRSMVPVGGLEVPQGRVSVEGDHDDTMVRVDASGGPSGHAARGFRMVLWYHEVVQPGGAVGADEVRVRPGSRR